MKVLNDLIVLRAVGVAVALLGSTFPAQAQAQSLSGNLSVDNIFTAYISTSPTGAGAQVATGNDWQVTHGFIAPLTVGQDHWLHIQAQNIGGPAAFIGSFSLTGTGFEFSNGTQTLLTNTTDWFVSITGFGVNEVGPSAFGANGAHPWFTRPGVDANAHFIWTNDACQGVDVSAQCTRYFSTKITAAQSTVPEPGTWALMGSGLLALGGVSLRRRYRA